MSEKQNLHDDPLQISLTPWNSHSFSLQYNWSLFKALAQMIMIGFETPPFTNVSCEVASDWCQVETWITLLCLYIGTVFYALLISNISSVVGQLNQAKRQFEVSERSERALMKTSMRASERSKQQTKRASRN